MLTQLLQNQRSPPLWLVEGFAWPRREENTECRLLGSGNMGNSLARPMLGPGRPLDSDSHQEENTTVTQATQYDLNLGDFHSICSKDTIRTAYESSVANPHLHLTLCSVYMVHFVV